MCEPGDDYGGDVSRPIICCDMEVLSHFTRDTSPVWSAAGEVKEIFRVPKPHELLG
jgi:hypothetical protein